MSVTAVWGSLLYGAQMRLVYKPLTLIFGHLADRADSVLWAFYTIFA